MKIIAQRLKGLAWGKGFWRVLCLLSALELALLPGMTALAQSDSSTPEANPQFQNSMQGSRTNSGSPVGSVSAVKAHAASASKALDQASSLSQVGAPPSGIQIGASTPPTPPRKKRIPSPLDTRVSIRVKGFGSRSGMGFNGGNASHWRAGISSRTLHGILKLRIGLRS